MWLVEEFYLVLLYLFDSVYQLCRNRILLERNLAFLTCFTAQKTNAKRFNDLPTGTGRTK